MANVFDPHWDAVSDGLRRARIGEQAGTTRIGLSVYELAPGESMVFHYHLQNEEVLVVLEGAVAVRTPDGWHDAARGDVCVFPRGAAGAHAYENRGDAPARVLLVAEANEPNVSVYPDAGRVGIFDVARRADRRFGALFDLRDVISGYGGADPTP